MGLSLVSKANLKLTNSSTSSAQQVTGLDPEITLFTLTNKQRFCTIQRFMNHSFVSVWRQFLLEVATGVYYMPGLGGSCNCAH